MLIATQNAEIGGTLENDDLIVFLRRVQREMQSEAGKAEVGRQRLLEFVAAEIEIVRNIRDRRGRAVFDRIDGDLARVDEAAMKELGAEQTAVDPHRAVMAIIDIAVVIVVEFLEFRRQWIGLILVGRRGQLCRHALHGIEGKRRRFRLRGRACRRERRLLRRSGICAHDLKGGSGAGGRDEIASGDVHD